MKSQNPKVKIGIVGCGAIGSGVAGFIDRDLKQSAVVTALADKDNTAAKKLKGKIRSQPRIYDTDALVKNSDLVIEAASQAAAEFILNRAILHRKDVIILSVGVFVRHVSLLKRAAAKKIKIYVPSGAICGIDGVAALSRGRIKSLSLTTTKPPCGLAGAAYLKEKKINLAGLEKAKLIFEGSVRDAVRHFPKNINVAAALLLASSFNNIRVRIIADPAVKRNIHTVEVSAREGNLSCSIENVPSPSNPKTSALAILSTQQLLKKLFSSFKIGS